MLIRIDSNCAASRGLLLAIARWFLVQSCSTWQK